MTLPTSRNQTYVAGAQVKSADLNDFQDWAINAYLRHDDINRALAYQSARGDGVGVLDYSLCYSLGFGAYPYPTGTALQIRSRAGVLAQIAPITGELLTHKLALDEISVTLAAGNATNPRIDVIQVKLDKASSGSFTTLAYSVKAGTPAATPVEEVVDAGYVKWASVLVPATYNAAFVATTHLRDYRFPLGRLQHEILYADRIRAGGWTFTTGGTGFRLQATAGAQFAWAYPTVLPGWRNARLLAVNIDCLITNAGAAEVKLCRGHYDGSTVTVLKDLGATYMTGARVNITTALDAEPWWARGYQGGPEAAPNETDSIFLSFASGANGDDVYRAWFQWGA